MEAVYYAARANLRRLMLLHPSWTRSQLAQATGMSRSWVDKWRKRLLHVPADDEQVLRGFSRAPHHPPPRLDPQVVDRLLEIRDDPPEGLGRTPGPKAILYYLSRDETLKEMQLRLPKSTRTIHRILHENGRIASRLPTFTDPIERPPPMQHWQLDAHQTLPPFLLIHTAKNNMSWKRSISSTKGLRSWWLIMSAPILQPRRLWRLLHKRSPSMVYLPPSRWTGTHAGWDHPKAVTFLPLSCASATPWASPCSFVIHITPNKMALSSATIAPSIRSV